MSLLSPHVRCAGLHGRRADATHSAGREHRSHQAVCSKQYARDRSESRAQTLEEGRAYAGSGRCAGLTGGCTVRMDSRQAEAVHKPTAMRWPNSLLRETVIVTVRVRVRPVSLSVLQWRARAGARVLCARAGDVGDGAAVPARAHAAAGGRRAPRGPRASARRRPPQRPPHPVSARAERVPARDERLHAAAGGEHSAHEHVHRVDCAQRAALNKRERE